MKRVFISGSISIKALPSGVVQSIGTIESKNFTVLVGDAPGVDALVQKKLARDGYKNVLVYTVWDKPRNCLSDHFHVVRVSVEPGIKSERKRQEEKDRCMTEAADYGLVLWDGKSKGSFNNIIRCMKSGKSTKVYLATENRFLDKEESTENKIAEIHKNHAGLTLQEAHQRIIKAGLSGFKTPEDLKSYLINQSFVVVKEHGIYPAKGYDRYFRIEKYRGHANLRYAPDLVELIRS